MCIYLRSITVPTSLTLVNVDRYNEIYHSQTDSTQGAEAVRSSLVMDQQPKILSKIIPPLESEQWRCRYLSTTHPLRFQVSTNFARAGVAESRFFEASQLT